MTGKVLADILDWTNMEHSSVWNDDVWFAVVAVDCDDNRLAASKHDYVGNAFLAAHRLLNSDTSYKDIEVQQNPEQTIIWLNGKLVP